MDLLNIPIFYINLKNREDKKEHIESELKKQKSLKNNKITRFEAISHEFGMYGCVLSHIGVLQIAIDNNYDSIMILEDDFKFLREITNEDINDIDFDVLFLDCYKRQTEDINTKYLQVFRGSLTTGYIVKRRFFQTLLDNYSEGSKLYLQNQITGHHLDVYSDLLKKKSYWIMSKNRIGYQIDGWSDILERRRIIIYSENI
jgi:glycosyl transferase family 25